MAIQLERPPIEGIDPNIVRYLDHLVDVIQDLTDQQPRFKPLNNIPTKLAVGRVYYFSRAIDATVNAEGLWLYKSTGWIQIA